MTQEIAKQSTKALDGFDGGGGDDGSESIIKGTRIKFGNATKPTTWVLSDGTPLPPETKYVAHDLLRVTQKWPPGDGNDPPATKILGADEKFPNVEELNKEVPKDKWRTGPNGGPKGPFENAYVLYLLDSLTAAPFTYVGSTVGGMRAVHDLRERVQWMREFRAEHVVPEVMLADCHMPTKHGGRRRPHFNILRWVTFGGGGLVVATDSPQLTGPQTVEPPSAKEVTKDSVPW